MKLKFHTELELTYAAVCVVTPSGSPPEMYMGSEFMSSEGGSVITSTPSVVPRSRNGRTSGAKMQSAKFCQRCSFAVELFSKDTPKMGTPFKYGHPFLSIFNSDVPLIWFSVYPYLHKPSSVVAVAIAGAPIASVLAATVHV